MTSLDSKTKPGKVLNVLIEPNAKLHQPALPVTEVNDETRAEFNDMLATMRHYEGVGLAAVQVGLMKKMLITDFAYFAKCDEDSRLCQPEGCSIMYMINPFIVDYSEETAEFTEGCLSLPGVFLTVKRPIAIKVEYQDYNGNHQQISLRGKIADCIQHEIDHLSGILITDKVSPLKRTMALKKLQKASKRQD